MKLLIRIVLIILAIPVAIILAGAIGGLLGFGPIETEPETEVVAEAPQEPRPYQKPIEADEQAGTAVQSATPQRIALAELPDPLDERSALEYLTQNRLLKVREGLIEIDAPRFSSLTSQQALALLWAFKDASNSATSDRRSSLRLLAGYVFMGAAYLPQVERLAFAQDGQIVAWPGSGSDHTRSGEFVLMFYLKGEPDQPRAEETIRRFAPMLPGSAILNALDRINAIKPRQQYDALWSYDMDKISHLSVETLETLVQYIGPYNSFGRDDEIEFGYAKDRLQDLIEDLRAKAAQ